MTQEEAELYDFILETCHNDNIKQRTVGYSHSPNYSILKRISNNNERNLRDERVTFLDSSLKYTEIELRQAMKYLAMMKFLDDNPRAKSAFRLTPEGHKFISDGGYLRELKKREREEQENREERERQDKEERRIEAEKNEEREKYQEELKTKTNRFWIGILIPAFITISGWAFTYCTKQNNSDAERQFSLLTNRLDSLKATLDSLISLSAEYSIQDSVRDKSDHTTRSIKKGK